MLVNGSPYREFNFSRVLRQKDPISPFLFLIVMEALHISIETVVNRGLIHGISMLNGGPILLTCVFADDVILLIEDNEEVIANLARLLKCFNAASGLKVSFKKSKLFGVGIDDSRLIGRSLLQFYVPWGAGRSKHVVDQKLETYN